MTKLQYYEDLTGEQIQTIYNSFVELKVKATQIFPKGGKLYDMFVYYE